MSGGTSESSIYRSLGTLQEQCEGQLKDGAITGWLAE